MKILSTLLITAYAIASLTDGAYAGGNPGGLQLPKNDDPSWNNNGKRLFANQKRMGGTLNVPKNTDHRWSKGGKRVMGGQHENPLDIPKNGDPLWNSNGRRVFADPYESYSKIYNPKNNEPGFGQYGKQRVPGSNFGSNGFESSPQTFMNNNNQRGHLRNNAVSYDNSNNFLSNSVKSSRLQKGRSNTNGMPQYYHEEEQYPRLYSFPPVGETRNGPEFSFNDVFEYADRSETDYRYRPKYRN